MKCWRLLKMHTRREIRRFRLLNYVSVFSMLSSTSAMYLASFATCYSDERTLHFSQRAA